MSTDSTPTTVRGPNLFDLTTDALALRSLLEEMEGEIPEDELGEQILRFLEDNTRALDEKLDGYVSVVAEFDAREELCRREARRYQERAQAAARHRERLLDRLKLFFVRTGKDSHATARHTIRLVRNGGALPLRIDPAQKPEQVPERFRKVKYEFDTDAIRRALAAGETLVFAELGERGSSIRIR